MFPPASEARPHVVYEYQVARDPSVTDIYFDPVFRRDDLIHFEEFVGGRFVKEVYHTEDFNMTEVMRTGFANSLPCSVLLSVRALH